MGLPKSEDPANPDFHVPRTNTGVGDFPGGDFIVSLGAFDDVDGLPIGYPVHAGVDDHARDGTRFRAPARRRRARTELQADLLSVMNYLYQLRGLLDDAGVPAPGFLARRFRGDDDRRDVAVRRVAELLPYRIGWYAPLATSYLSTIGTPVAKHCNGSPLLPTDPAMVRIDARTAASADRLEGERASLETQPVFSQDVDFDGAR